MKRALLVIDVQNEYFTGKLPVKYPKNSFTNILKAMDCAKENGVSVILIQHTNPDEDAITFNEGTSQLKIHDDVLKRNHAITIEKTLLGSFTGTELESWLGKNIKQVVICGYMTQMCCDTTAKQAMIFGFQCRILERCHWNTGCIKLRRRN